MKNDSAEFSSPHMRRSISLTSNPKYFENKKLQRTAETECLNALEELEESAENIELLYSRNNSGKTTKVKHLQNKNKLDNVSKESECESELNNDANNEYYVGLFNTKRQFRLVEKNGKENVVLRRIPYRSWHFMKDIVTTLIECDWKCTLALFLLSYCLSWLLFAVFCYWVSYKHGDFNRDPYDVKEPCIHGVHNFLSVLIYSIETQTTVGFGAKYPSEECPETIALFILQIICSIAIEGAMISLIYVKTARPVRQLAKLKFSDKAVICYRDGKLCLIFRVCDPLEKQSIGTKIRAYLILEQPTADGEILNSHVELKLEGKGEKIITWPELLCHVIDEHSPLHHLTSAKGFNSAKFELYVSIVGVSPTTAQVTESRTSYVPREIFWGQTFINIIHYDGNDEHYVVDYSNFNTTISVDMKTVDKSNEETNL